MHFKVKRNYANFLLIWVVALCFTMISSTSFQCNNTVTIPNIQYSIQNIYITTSTDIILQSGYLGNSGAVYYAASTAASTAVFSKMDSSGTIQWAKSYSSFPFYHQSFIVLSDESVFYWIEEGSTTHVNILKIDAANGNLITQYIE